MTSTRTARLLSVNVGCRAIFLGEAIPSTQPCGRLRYKGVAWCAGSTSMATARATWTGTAASTVPSASIN